jgi:2-keto-3-deoxy-L-rhamnonate aldolase RhmA
MVEVSGVRATIRVSPGVRRTSVRGASVRGVSVRTLNERRMSVIPFVALTALAGCGGGQGDAPIDETDPAVAQSTLIRLWAADTPAFGIFVPSERERGARGPDGERPPALYTAAGGARHAANPLLDYLFLNLEGAYDLDAVSAIAEGLASTDSDMTLLVRIPPISTDGADVARARVAEALAAGADGITIPHVRSPEEARMAVSFFEDIGADVWSPSNPGGTVIAMLMIEDADALAATQEIADVNGYSSLACGIGSLTNALGDREAAEAGNQVVLAAARRVGRPDVITANSDNVAQRIEEGFLGLLMGGPDADAHIQTGRAAAGR